VKECAVLIYFVVITRSCDGVFIVCITGIYMRKGFISCALVELNGTGICKVSFSYEIT
jgi:hypothetical protein